MTFVECISIGHRVGIGVDHRGRKLAYRDPVTKERIAYQLSRIPREQIKSARAKFTTLPRERVPCDALYVMRAALPFATDASLVKVGRAMDPDKRLRSIVQGFPHELELVCALPRMGYAEALVHEALSQWTATPGRRSEWFWVPDDIMSTLEALDLSALGVSAERLELVLRALEAAR